MFEQKEFSLGGIRLVSLTCRTGDGTREILVAPDYGMNLCRFSVNGRNVIDYEPEAVKYDFSGTPLLYPTPNRVWQGIFRYDGRAKFPSQPIRTLFRAAAYTMPFRSGTGFV